MSIAFFRNIVCHEDLYCTSKRNGGKSSSTLFPLEAQDCLLLGKILNSILHETIAILHINDCDSIELHNNLFFFFALLLLFLEESWILCFHHLELELLFMLYLNNPYSKCVYSFIIQISWHIFLWLS